MYYGWRVVVLSIVIYILVFGSTVSSFSLYVVPVSAEFGLSRAEMNAAFVLINAGSAIWAPLIGRALDRFSLRLILALSAVLMSVGFVMLSLSHAIWLSALALITGIAIGLDGAAMLTMTVLVARWFKVRRARAMTISVTGQALGKVLVPVPTALLIENYGWRTTLIVVGVLLVTVLSLIAAFVRDRPGASETEPGGGGGGSASREVTDALADAGGPAGIWHLLRMPRFWLIAVSIAMTFAISGTLAISMVPLALDYGLTMTQGALMASAYASAAVATKLLLAVFADRINRFALVVALLLVGVPLFATFLLIQGQVQLVLLVILLGLSVGGFAALFPVLQADVYGLAAYGTVRGLMTPIQAAFIALGAFAAGWIHDLTGSYHMMFVVFAVSQTMAAAMLHLARSSTQPRRAGAGVVGVGMGQ